MAIAMLGASPGRQPRPAPAAPATLAAPPSAPERPIATQYAGTRVVDPYRYLEDGRDPATRAFFTSRDRYARAVLARLDPARANLFKRISALDRAVTEIDDLARAGDTTYYLRRGPRDAAPVLCARDANGAERALVDPMQDLARGRHASITSFLPSHDGRFVAYAIAPDGSEESELHVLDVRAGVDLPERIANVRGVGATAWTADDRSFVYDRYPPLLPKHDPRDERRRPIAFRHDLGRSPELDTPLFGGTDVSSVRFGPDDRPIVRLSATSPYALGLVRHGGAAERSIYTAPATLATSRSSWQLVAGPGDGVTDAALSGGTLFLLDHRGGGSTLRAQPLGDTNLADAVVLLTFPPPAIVERIGVARDGLYVALRRGGAGSLERFALGSDGATRGTPQILALPAAGAIATLATDSLTTGATVRLATWLAPARTFAFTPDDGFTDPRIAAATPLAAFAGAVADDETARAADGTPVPITILRGPRTPRDGRRPALLDLQDAAGGDAAPSFVPARAAWLEHGGIVAICHPRGGRWSGDVAYAAGIGAAQPRAVDDALACADHLVRRGSTSASRLVVAGSGLAGVAVADAVLQRPQLFAAALDLDGASDLFRHASEAYGPFDADVFGSPDDPAGARALLAASPAARVAPNVDYPAFLLAASATDARVAPWEPAKLAARLERAQSGRRPILFRLDADAGAGGPTATREQNDGLLADAYAFGLWQAGDLAFAFVPENAPGVGTPAAHSERTISPFRITP